jgi:hypothetical protein
MSDKEFQVLCATLEDQRRLIAAGKAQRWDVIKWGVSINLGLATVAAVAGSKPDGKPIVIVGASMALQTVNFERSHGTVTSRAE